MDERDQLISDLDQARADMRSLLEEIDKNRKIYPLWTIREILAHIAGWDDAIIASLRAHIAGDVPEVSAPRGIDAYNAQTVETREGLDYDHIIREYESTRETLKQFLRDMPENRFRASFTLPWGPTGTVTQVIDIFSSHELEHAHEIRAIMHRANQ